MMMCGIYFRDRRFWVCKFIILIMDLAILRGSMSMGEEYCSQDDDISEVMSLPLPPLPFSCHSSTSVR